MAGRRWTVPHSWHAITSSRLPRSAAATAPCLAAVDVAMSQLLDPLLVRSLRDLAPRSAEGRRASPCPPPRGGNYPLPGAAASSVVRRSGRVLSGPPWSPLPRDRAPRPGSGCSSATSSATTRKRRRWPTRWAGLTRRGRSSPSRSGCWASRASEPGLEHLDPDRSAKLEPPWPDLILTVGRRPSMAALWVQDRSGGRARIVLVGRPKRWADRFALIVAPSQFRIPRATTWCSSPCR